jgi:hypothetical protein
MTVSPKTPINASPTTLEAAQALHARGFAVIPLPPRSKNPNRTGWQNERWSADDLPGQFAPTSNIGILCGEPSAWVDDVDLDCAAALQLADTFLPETGCIFGRPGSPRSHRLYVAEGAGTLQLKHPVKNADNKQTTLIELRSTGLQSVAPGSVHPSGEKIRWDRDGEPAVVDAAVLRRQVELLAAASLLATEYPGLGVRHAFRCALAGGCFSSGMREDGARQFVHAVSVAGGANDLDDAISCVADTYSRARDGRETTGWPTMGELIDERVIAKAKAWIESATMSSRLGASTASANGQHDPDAEGEPQGPDGLQLTSFFAYLPKHKYIFRKDGSIWDPAGVNAGLPPVSTEMGIVSPAKYLDKTRAVHQLTWVPGQPELIEDALITGGGLEPAPGFRAYNLYRGPDPLPEGSDPRQAGPWLAHIELLYPDDAHHIVSWFASRVQHPGVKINHALVLGGTQGIGKDTLLDPVVRAVGAHNVSEESPATVTGRFNKFLRSVILRISEARDLGDVDRFGFYEHMKAILASPPDVLSVEQKFIDAYPIPNVVGVVYTTNNRHTGLYLPAEDRRHYVAWSELAPSDFDAGYFGRFYTWYETGGYGHVAAYLHACELDSFNPKAPPPKTDAFWAMVDTGRAPEEGGLLDLLEKMGEPDAVTVKALKGEAGVDSELSDLFYERKLRTQIPHRMSDVGYIPVRNPYANDGLWVVGGKRTAIYAKAKLSTRDRIVAAGGLL